jgi:hypothetical protein
MKYIWRSGKLEDNNHLKFEFMSFR